MGSGFAGAVIAERLAQQCGLQCLIIERRTHTGGNALDEYDAAGVLVHCYGPHYFRTDSLDVVDYLSRFTEWHPVEYKILSYVNGRYYQFPINLNTFEQILGRESTSEEMKQTLADWRVPFDEPRNSEEVILSQVGRNLYEMFFENYTRKQWKCEPSELSPSVCGRIPVRTTRDDRYVTAGFQALPRDGYHGMFRHMLNHPKIRMLLNTDYQDVREFIQYRHLVYTGAIDEFYGYRFGVLPYRSLRFERETFRQTFFQPAMQVNYPNDHEYTRIVEIKHATGQDVPYTTIVREYPDDYSSTKNAYYPVPTQDAQAMYGRYAALAQNENNVSLVGRLATYRYCDMDEVVSDALSECRSITDRMTNRKVTLVTAKPEVMVVMPVFNEQASVKKVVQEWFSEISNWTEDFVFLAINDGSQDGTLRILRSLRDKLGSRFEIHDQDNRGHGQSCLVGYRIAHERGIPFVFQIDSDGQCDPQFFFKFWRLRAERDVIYGVRTKRDDGARRMLVSRVLRVFLLTMFKTSCQDANVPYRLMRTEKVHDHVQQIPGTVNLANVALAVLLRRDRAVRHEHVPIRFRDRYGGEPTVAVSRFGSKAAELYRDLRHTLRRQGDSGAMP